MWEKLLRINSKKKCFMHPKEKSHKARTREKMSESLAKGTCINAVSIISIMCSTFFLCPQATAISKNGWKWERVESEKTKKAWDAHYAHEKGDFFVPQFRYIRIELKIHFVLTVSFFFICSTHCHFPCNSSIHILFSRFILFQFLSYFIHVVLLLSLYSVCHLFFSPNFLL